MLTLSYYRSRADGQVYAIVCRGGRAVQAAGPIADWRNTDPRQLGPQSRDARGWDMREFVPVEGAEVIAPTNAEAIRRLVAKARETGHFDTRDILRQQR